MIEELNEKNYKLIPKDEAEFLFYCVIGIIPFGAGYPVDAEITFEDGGQRYSISF